MPPYGGSSSSSSSTATADSAVDYDDKIKRMRKAANGSSDYKPRKFYKDKDFLGKLSSLDCPEGQQLKRVDARKITAREFRKKYEKKNIPCIITNLEKFPAHKKWTIKNLKKKYGDEIFPFYKNKFRLSLRDYLRYCEEATDDSPIYLFEENLNAHPKILKDYFKPEFFEKYDLFGVLPDELRPPYHWLIIGPARTGTTCHIDPLGTSAWNALIQGHKRWVLFPEKTPRSDINPEKYTSSDTRTEASHWWHDVYPHLKIDGTLEGIQGPGETIFVPGGWWHGVLNLDTTVCVTENFVSKHNLERVWKACKAERPLFAERWEKVLALEEPDMHEKLDDFSASTNSSGSSTSDSPKWAAIDRLPAPSTSEGKALQAFVSHNRKMGKEKKRRSTMPPMMGPPMMSVRAPAPWGGRPPMW